MLMFSCQTLTHKDKNIYFVAYHDYSAMYFERPKGGIDGLYGDDFNNTLECQEHLLEPEQAVLPEFETCRTSVDSLRVLPDEVYWHALEKHGHDELYTARLCKKDLIEYAKEMGWMPK